MQIRSLGRENPLEEETANPLQYSCLGNPMDREAWRTTVHGVSQSWTQLSMQSMYVQLQPRRFIRVFCNILYICVCISVCCVLSRFSRVQLFATLRTGAFQTPLSMKFSRQEYQSGLPCPSPQDLPNPGIEPAFLMSHALAGRFFTTSPTWEISCVYVYIHIHMCTHSFFQILLHSRLLQI